MIKNYSIPERFKGFSLEMARTWGKNLKVNRDSLNLRNGQYLASVHPIRDARG